MSSHQDQVKLRIFSKLRASGMEPVALSSDGTEIPVPDEADAIQFKIPVGVVSEDGTTERHPEKKVTITLSIDDNNELKLYYSNKATSSPDWEEIRNYIKSIATSNRLTFDPVDQSQLKPDMAKREYMKKQEISESYMAINRRLSHNDAIPTVKIVLHHSRALEENEQRFRNIEKIYLENVDGERIKCPVNNGAMAKIFARVLAEGDKPYSDRWRHVQELCEEYDTIYKFVRATRNINAESLSESAISLVNNGMQHRLQLKETLQKMMGHRGYNTYFENWTPTLVESEDTDLQAPTIDLHEMFGDYIDDRIIAAESVLSKIYVPIVEDVIDDTTDELSEWAEELINESLGVKDTPVVSTRN